MLTTSLRLHSISFFLAFLVAFFAFSNLPSTLLSEAISSSEYSDFEPLPIASSEPFITQSHSPLSTLFTYSTARLYILLACAEEKSISSSSSTVRSLFFLIFLEILALSLSESFGLPSLLLSSSVSAKSSLIGRKFFTELLYASLLTEDSASSPW